MYCTGQYCTALHCPLPPQVPLLVGSSFLAARGLLCVLGNLTTNELLNRRRYGHLNHEVAGYCNRFDAGPLANCAQVRTAWCVGWDVYCLVCGLGCVLPGVWAGVCTAWDVGWGVYCLGCGQGCALPRVWAGVCTAWGVGWDEYCLGCGLGCVLPGVYCHVTLCVALPCLLLRMCVMLRTCIMLHNG